MKPSAFNNTLKVAKAIWNNAKKLKITKLENPFMGIDDIDIKNECETREKMRLNKQQVDLLLNTAKSMYSDYTYTIIATAVYSGMRQGEILGLTWANVDLSNNTISIRQQTQKLTKNDIKEELKKNPEKSEKDILLTSRLKTKGSKRTIPIAPILSNILKEYKKHLMASGQLNDLCFCDTEGMPLVARDFVKYRYHNVVKKAFNDEKFVHFQELRGSFATILHLEGVPSKIIQELLRHEKLSTTEDIYIEVNLKNKKVTESLKQVFSA